MKVQAEGNELNNLKGGLQFNSNRADNIIIEVPSTRDQSREGQTIFEISFLPKSNGVHYLNLSNFHQASDSPPLLSQMDCLFNRKSKSKLN